MTNNKAFPPDVAAFLQAFIDAANAAEIETDGSPEAVWAFIDRKAEEWEAQPPETANADEDATQRSVDTQ